MIVEFLLPKWRATRGRILSASRLFESLHEYQKIAVRPEPLDERTKVVRHCTIGVNTKIVFSGRALEVSNESFRPFTVYKDTMAELAAKCDEEPLVPPIAQCVESNIFAAKSHGCKLL